MTQRFRFVLVMAGAVGLAAATGLAQAPAQPETPPGARAPRAEGLNLTDAQRDEMRKLREEHRAATRDAAQKLRDANRQLREALYAASLDETKIAALKTEIAELSQQLQARRFDQQERMARILTPEQRQLVRERRIRMDDRRRARMQRLERQLNERQVRRQFLRRHFRDWM